MLVPLSQNRDRFTLGSIVKGLCITSYLYGKEIFLTEPLEEESFENGLITVLVDK